MNLKKGFTLVELLAVIIVLGVITLIVIPRVNNVIRGSRDAAFVQNNNNIIRAADNFMNANRSMFNLDIGESIEVSFQQMIDADFLAPIKNPHGSNQCSGYVIFTRTVSGTFSTMPITDCINDNINSSENRGLVLYYDFNNFSEPTQNFIREPIITDLIGNKVIPNTWFLRDPNYEYGTVDYGTSVDGRHDANSIYALVESNEWQNRWDISWDIASFDPNIEYTFSIYGKVPSIDDSPGLSLNFQGTDSAGQRVDFTRVVNFTQSNEWERLSVTARPSDFNAVSYINYMKIYPRAATYTPPVEFKLSAPQMEEKPYATPFTVGTREGVVRNAVSDNYHSVIPFNTTPKWVNDSVNGRGSYYFNGENRMIRSDNNLSLYGSQTFSFWMKPEQTSGLQGLVSLHSHSQTANLGINLHNNNITTSIGYTDGTREWNNTRSNYSVVYGEWQHVVTVYNDEENSITYYIDGEFDSTHILGKEVDFVDGRLLIGQWSLNYIGNYIYEGYLDDIMLFERSLTNDEVKQLYLSSLR